MLNPHASARTPVWRPSIPRKVDPHAHHDAHERHRRRSRRAPRGRQNVTQLIGDDGQAAQGTALRRMQERGFVHEIVGELKSGKEATVYLGRSPLGDVAVKIFRDVEVRSFKNDQRYHDGRWVGDARLAKAIRHRSGRGRRALKAMWAAHEYLMLWRLWRAGIHVPEPLVGPEAFDIAEAGEVVLMRFVGEADAPAPRLSDAVLDDTEARSAFDQAVDLMVACWRHGVVHGDLSAYSLLWWRGQVVLIDFPQSMERERPGAEELLAQDAASLALSFRRLGVEADADEILQRVRAAD